MGYVTADEPARNQVLLEHIDENVEQRSGQWL
jgi:hypothetical protein